MDKLHAIKIVNKTNTQSIQYLGESQPVGNEYLSYYNKDVNKAYLMKDLDKAKALKNYMDYAIGKDYFVSVVEIETVVKEIED